MIMRPYIQHSTAMANVQIEPDSHDCDVGAVRIEWHGFYRLQRETIRKQIRDVPVAMLRAQNRARCIRYVPLVEWKIDCDSTRRMIDADGISVDETNILIAVI